MVTNVVTFLATCFRCFYRFCKRKELGLTELLANLAVSKKIKGHLFVHSKVLGILIFSQQSAV